MILQPTEMMDEAMFQNTRWSIGTEWRLGYNDIMDMKQKPYWSIYW